MTDSNNDGNRDQSLHDKGVSDSADGMKDKLTGHAKDAWGGLTGDTKKQAEGKIDEAKGEAKDRLGKAEKDLGI
jgi:uncharacterized protein YjbJ (UPF0337 family)